MNESERGFFELRYYQAIALPRVLAQFFDALRKLNRSAELNRFETCRIDVFDNRDDHAGTHVVSPETLLAIAQSGIDKNDVSHRPNFFLLPRNLPVLNMTCCSAVIPAQSYSGVNSAVVWI